MPGDRGAFSGNPKTEWLSPPEGNAREMRLLEDFAYTDPDGRVWPAPAGSIVNGASIPRVLWAIVGSPYTDDYRNASVVHDVAVGDPAVIRREADRMFYYACLAGDCSKSQARLLYAGVRLGDWSSAEADGASSLKRAPLYRKPPTEHASEKALRRCFKRLAAKIATAPGSLSFEQLEELVDRAVR